MSPRKAAGSARLTRTLLVLTFVTGIVDAVSFLALGQVFAAMQTGNVIFLGLGIAGTAAAPLAAPLVGLGSFLLGGCLAAAIALPRARRHPHLLRFATAVEVVLLGAAALLVALADPSPGAAAAYVAIAVLSLAMGLRTTIARWIGDPNLATTVLNLSLSAIATPTASSVASRGELGERLVALLAILAGAVTSALLLKTSTALPIATAAAIALAANLTLSRPPPQRRPAIRGGGV